jgi:hypothetical protein
MSLNINATLVSGELQHPIILPLSECTDVEIDDNVHATRFKGVKFVFPAQDISGKVGYYEEMVGRWVPYRFENPVEMVGDICIENKLLLQLLLTGDTTEIPVNGNSSWIQVREVMGIDDESWVGMHKHSGMHKIFELEGFDAMMTISV